MVVKENTGEFYKFEVVSKVLPIQIAIHFKDTVKIVKSTVKIIKNTQQN